MESKTFPSLNKLLFIILIKSLIFKISSLYFAYPSAITLNNGNILIAHQDGITICDANFTKIIKNVVIFSPKILNNEVDLYKVSIDQFSDGYVLCFIFNKIYLMKHYLMIMI